MRSSDRALIPRPRDGRALGHSAVRIRRETVESGQYDVKDFFAVRVPIARRQAQKGVRQRGVYDLGYIIPVFKQHGLRAVRIRFDYVPVHAVDIYERFVAAVAAAVRAGEDRPDGQQGKRQQKRDCRS